MRTVSDIFAQIFATLGAQLRSVSHYFHRLGSGSLLLLVCVGEGFRRVQAELLSSAKISCLSSWACARGKRQMNSAPTICSLPDSTEIRAEWPPTFAMPALVLSRTDLHEVS